MPKPTPHHAAGPPPILPDRSPSLPVPGDARLPEVCRRLGVSMLVLFGSRVPGRLPSHADSDVDLAWLRKLEGLVGAG